ncbi:hypothetical protein [uncultured Shewanella sp.]|uniref:hypothetical protein n=1 Tax=uncultured Shewanella sp. TaxID=173975 RepID=UPI002617B6C5|nr:hypothetical protein [uncultured Shewanella sp.]
MKFQCCRRTRKASQDKRINTQALPDDKAYAELNYYLHQYKKLEKRFHRKSKLTRHIACYSLPIALMAILATLGEQYYDIKLPEFFSRLSVIKPHLSLIAIIGLVAFCWAYFTNHLLGFTRGWSRNRLMREHLERLIREYQLAVHEQDKNIIRIEQDNILSKLSHLEEQNRIQTHKDIVGDYHTANTGVMNWLKIKK